MNKINQLKKHKNIYQVKKRCKMYKAKKRWIFVPILFIGLASSSMIGAKAVSASELNKSVSNEQAVVNETLLLERKGQIEKEHQEIESSANATQAEATKDNLTIKETLEIRNQSGQTSNDNKNSKINEVSSPVEEQSKQLNKGEKIQQEKEESLKLKAKSAQKDKQKHDLPNLGEELSTEKEQDKLEEKSIKYPSENNRKERNNRIKREANETNLISGDLKVNGKDYEINNNGKNVDLIITMEKLPSIISGSVINNGQSFNVELPSILSEALKNQEDKSKNVNIKLLTSGGTVLFDSETKNKDYGNWLNSMYAAEVEHRQERENSNIFSNLDIFNIGNNPYATKTIIYINNVYDKKAKMQHEASNSLYGDRYIIKLKYTFDKEKLQKILANLNILEQAKMDLPLFYSGKTGDPITGIGVWSSPENHTVSSSDLKDILNNINQTEKIKQIAKDKIAPSNYLSKTIKDKFLSKVKHSKNPDDVKKLIEEVVDSATKIATSGVEDYKKNDTNEAKKDSAKKKVNAADKVITVFEEILRDSKNPKLGPNSSIVVFDTPIDNSGKEQNALNHVTLEKHEAKKS
ncbi:hypothetical protein IBL99_002941, partial [Listeria monocytogenes]|nr:hypothetical protein [Listeria monocytogenes]